MLDFHFCSSVWSSIIDRNGEKDWKTRGYIIEYYESRTRRSINTEILLRINKKKEYLCHIKRNFERYHLRQKILQRKI